MATSNPDLGALIEALPGMDRVFPALEGLPPTYLVGGALRDLLRGAVTKDLDLAVEGRADAVARELAQRLGGEVEGYERFGTATVRAGDLRLDLAAARRERYRLPGALPEVEPATIEEDLGRRDFTINAMAAALVAEERGRLHDPHGGRHDLEAGVIRILHRHSFVDDPTRLLRAVRYEARLGFAMDRDTEALARAAAADRVAGTVSAKRIGDELLQLLAEEPLPAALARLADLGLDRALDPALAVDPDFAAAAAEAAPAVGADRAMAALAALVTGSLDVLGSWLEGLDLGAQRRDRVVGAARAAGPITAALNSDPLLPDSELRRLLARPPPEALALARALDAPPEPISRYLEDLRAVRLDIGGDDLLAAGIEPSPTLGRALAETLRRKLDGEVSGREEELRLALALAREETR